MGKVLSIITKPIRDFNVESRAHAVISREKPTIAPKHKSDQIGYERIIKEYPDAMKELVNKNEQLDKHLKSVFLTSHDPLVEHKLPQEDKQSSDKPLPLNRTSTPEFEYGFHEPKRVALGKVTLRKALRFISEHHADSKTYNAVKIAEDYLLPEKTVENILKFFKMYEIYIPKERTVRAKFAGPVVPRKRIITEKQRLLGSSVQSDKDAVN